MFIAAAVSLALAIAGGVIHFGRIQFGGMDGGVLTNAAWQLHLGYDPYRDVANATPPFFLLGGKWAFDIWGVQWASLTKMTAVFAAVTFLVHVFLLFRCEMGPGWSLLIPTYTQCAAILTGSYWWYNGISGVIGAIFFTCAWLLYKDSASFANRILFVVSASILALVKANVAVVFLATTFVALAWIGKRPRLAVSAYSLAGVLSILLLLLAGINPFFVVRAYLEWGERALSPEHFIRFIFLNQDSEPIQTFILLALFLAGAAILALRTDWISFSTRSAGGLRRCWGFFSGIKPDLIGPIVFFIIGVFASIVMMGTNNSLNFGELPPLLTGGVILLHSAKRYFRGARTKTIAASLVAASVILLTANALRWTWQRIHIYYVGPETFYQDLPLTRLASPPFFNGTYVGPRLAAVLDDMDQLLKTKDYRRGTATSIFFGPRIDFAYAAFDIPPVPGFPLWWEAFQDDGKLRTKLMVERFKRTRFKLAVFLHRDYAFFPQSLIDYLNREYIVYDTKTLTIHELREEPDKEKEMRR